MVRAASSLLTDPSQILSRKPGRCVVKAVKTEGRGDEVEIELGGEVLLLAGTALALVVT
jgi:hypothetical protein